MTLILDDAGMNRVIRGRHGVFAYNRHDVYIGRALQKYGEFSELEGELLRGLCRPGEVVVEVGANIGAHTIPLAKQIGATGLVIAFEPQPVVFQTLCGNVALNSLCNVQCVHAAVGRAARDVCIPELRYDQPNNFGGVSVSSTETAIKVRCVVLDEELKVPSLRLLKVDVEGMEREVILGATDLIRRCRPALYVENDRVDRSRELIETILSLDYDLFWHFPPMFNPANFAGESENVFGNIVSSGMLCVPRDRASQVTGLQPVADSSEHPMRRPAPESKDQS